MDRPIHLSGWLMPAALGSFGCCRDHRLWVTDIEILRLHYAETLRQWSERSSSAAARHCFTMSTFAGCGNSIWHHATPVSGLAAC
jgi:cyclopropane fatty-acyl-phospholipid synthase-like methyltransferase